MKYFIVYKTTHIPTGKFYIGRHVTENLFDEYLGSGVKISRMVKKYGTQEFSKEILKLCSSPDEMIQIEIEEIRKVFQEELCLNLMIGDPRFTGGVEFSDETKKKMSESKKKTHNTIEVRKKLSEVQKARSEQIKAHNTRIHKGKTISDEMKQKQSLALSGEKNPRAKEWKIYFENGDDPIIVKGVKQWCNENGLKYISLYMKVKRNDFSFYHGVRIEPLTPSHP